MAPQSNVVPALIVVFSAAGAIYLGLPLVALSLVLLGVAAYGVTSYTGGANSGSSSSSGSGSGDGEIIEEIQEALSQTSGLRGRLNQKIKNSMRLAEDEKQKTTDLEERFNELRDQPFESAAQKFIQDENLPEPVRKEMQRLVEEVEDMENKEGSLLQVLRQVEKEESFELKELKEAEGIEEQVEKELEEVAQEEVEAENFLTGKRQKVQEINQDLQKSLQTYRQAVRQGNEARAQQLRQRIQQDRQRLGEIRGEVSRFVEEFGDSVGPILSDARSKLGEIGRDLKDVRAKSEQVEEELGEEEELAGELEEEVSDEKDKMEDEWRWFEGHETSEGEEDLFAELGSDASEAADEAEAEAEIVDEEEKEQENIEEGEKAEEEIFKSEKTTEKEEEVEAENIEEEAEDIVEGVDEVLEESGEAINEGKQVEEESMTELENLIQNVEEENQQVLYNHRRQILGFPQYYATVFDAIIKAVENPAHKNQVDLKDAQNILRASEAAISVVDDSLGLKKVVDLAAAIESDPSYEVIRPSWNDNFSVDRYYEIKENPSRVLRSLQSDISSLNDEVREEFRTPEPITFLLMGAGNGDTYVDAIYNKTNRDDLAAALFVAECIFRALERALQNEENEELVNRLNETTF